MRNVLEDFLGNFSKELYLGQQSSDFFEFKSDISNPNISSPQPRNIPAAPLGFGSALIFSAIAQPPVTWTLMAIAGKNKGIPYPQTTKNFFSLPFGNIVSQGAQTLKRRTVASLFPASVSDAIAEKFGLSSAQVTTLSAMSESAVAIMMRESKERFHAFANPQFPILNEKKLGVDLIKISSFEEFKKLCANNPATSKFATEEWKILKEMQNNFHGNFTLQAASLLLRNGMFSAAVFMAKPLAQKFVDENQEVFKAAGLSQNAATEISTNVIRASLAWLTTPIDRIFTMASIGQNDSTTILSNVFKNFKEGDVTKFFTGAMARTALCVIAANAIVKGFDAGKFLKTEFEKRGIVDDAFEAIARNFKALEEKLNISGDKDIEKSTNQAVRSEMNIGEIKQPDVEKSLDAARKSHEIMTKTAEEISKPSTSAESVKAAPISDLPSRKQR